MPHNHDLPSHISILKHDDPIPTKYGTRMKQRFIGNTPELHEFCAYTHTPPEMTMTEVMDLYS
jgi:hypothetical protein